MKKDSLQQIQTSLLHKRVHIYFSGGCHAYGGLIKGNVVNYFCFNQVNPTLSTLHVPAQNKEHEQKAGRDNMFLETLSFS